LADPFADVGLGYEGYHRSDVHGNEYAYRTFAHARTAAGQNRAQSPLESEARRRWIYDVCFVQ
jgi:hypothetical protein